MITSNNYTVFGIHSTAERYSWSAYHLFVLLSSLIGDTLILYASFHKEAFQINHFIVTVIQYISVSDLAVAITGVLPGPITLIGNTWELGNAMCYATVYVRYIFYQAGMSLIAVMTTGKVILLKYPFRSPILNKKMAHQACGIAFIPSLAVLVCMLVVDRSDVAFDYKNYACNYEFKADIWQKLLLPIFSIFTMFIPNIVIVATTIPTLKYLYDAIKSARRAGGSVPWRGTVTVALTAIVYCVSSLPLCIYYILKDFVDEQLTSPFQFQYYRISYFVCMINIMSNFYIYTLTISSFRRFLLSKILANQSALSIPSSLLSLPSFLGVSILSIFSQTQGNPIDSTTQQVSQQHSRSYIQGPLITISTVS